MRGVSRHLRFAAAVAALWIATMPLQADAQPAKSVEAPPDALLSPTIAAVNLTNGSRADGTVQKATGEGLFGAVRARETGHSATQSATRRDSVLNGVLIGAGIGALLGLIPDYYDDCEECHDSLYASIAVGAGVGLLVDALRNGRQAVSPSRPDGALRLGVVIGSKGVGLGGAVRWK